MGQSAAQRGGRRGQVRVHIPSVDIGTQGVKQITWFFHNFTDKATSTVLSSSLIAPGRIAHSLLVHVQSPQSSY